MEAAQVRIEIHMQPFAAAVFSNDLTAIGAHPYKVRMIMNLLQKGWYFTSLT